MPVDEYLSALDAELRVRFASSPSQEVDTIYFGGGTPSRLGGPGVARALELVRRHFVPTENAEITLEANPEDIDRASAEEWRRAGVNRLSIGAQSFDDRVLQWMHRTHDASRTTAAVESAREAGITNLSLDLIFALPEALQRDFERDVEQIIALVPDHVSLYGLTIEPKTPLGRWVGQGLTVEQPEEGYENDFLTAHRLLAGAGFEHYEVSNYGRPGRRARHNSAYWSSVPYVGLGPAAHGFDEEIRRWNARHYAEWRDMVMSGADPMEGEEQLTAENRIAEQVYLGMRSDVGLELQSGDMEVVQRWVELGGRRLGLMDDCAVLPKDGCGWTVLPLP